MNQTRFTACIVEIGVLRLTPAGVPALDARLEHESQQEEGGSPRQVKAALRAVALGAVAERLGKQAVGSLVVFEQGLPRKDQYRRFRIRSGDTPDDFRMMREVLSRRFSHNPEDRRSFDGLPELLVGDGGKGQLGVAVAVLEELGLRHRVDVCGLAKENEWLFVPGRSEPIILPRTSRALLMVTHLRDETHRFGVSYHRGLRDRQLKKSMLDEVPGIGEGRKQALLKHFGSVRKLLVASLDELAEVEGVGPKLAEQLHRYLQERR